MIFIEGVNIPLIIVKSDGGFNYASTDLAALWLVFFPLMLCLHFFNKVLFIDFMTILHFFIFFYPCCIVFDLA